MSATTLVLTAEDLLSRVEVNLPPFTEQELRNFVAQYHPSVPLDKRHKYAVRCQRRELTPSFKNGIIATLRHNLTNYDELLASVEPRERSKMRGVLQGYITSIIKSKYPVLA